MTRDQVKIDPNFVYVDVHKDDTLQIHVLIDRGYKPDPTHPDTNEKKGIMFFRVEKSKHEETYCLEVESRNLSKQIGLDFVQLMPFVEAKDRMCETDDEFYRVDAQNRNVPLRKHSPLWCLLHPRKASQHVRFLAELSLAQTSTIHRLLNK